MWPIATYGFTPRSAGALHPTWAAGWPQVLFDHVDGIPEEDGELQPEVATALRVVGFVPGQLKQPEANLPAAAARRGAQGPFGPGRDRERPPPSPSLAPQVLLP